MTDLSTPLSRIDPKTAAHLAKARGVHTVGDLLWFLPRRYLPRHGDLGTLVEGAYVVVVGKVERATTRHMGSRRGRMLNAVITDNKHELALTFFNAYGHEGQLVAGRFGLFAGTVSRYRGAWQLAHPAYEMFDVGLDEDEVAEAKVGVARERPLIPVYARVPKLPSWNLARAAQIVLDMVEVIEDPVPLAVRRRRQLPGLRDSFRMAHQPRSWEETRTAFRRFRYDEALTIQTVLAQRRRAAEQQATLPRRARAGGLLEAFDRRLPFDLTGGQVEVGEQIAHDLGRDHPMHRLLQGEVGSGKTVVALRAMLAVIDAGGQAALLAPTEVLAAQHHRSVTAMLGDLAQAGLLGGSDIGTRVALLMGSQSAGARRAALLQASSGEAGIVIGTHALIQDHVQFADLGLVVVDEQHRFGVQQRDALRGKAAVPPHVLVMTATPIPRTVAMTVFGDMETSTLTELPPGRSPISTHVVSNPRWLQRTWARVAEEVRAGHQVYVVCPRIGDEDGEGSSGERSGATSEPGDEVEAQQPERGRRGERELDSDDVLFDPDCPGPGVGELGPVEPQAAPRELRSVVPLLEQLRGDPVLHGLRLGMLHGRLPPDVKDAAMAAFAAGEIDVLVSTTVIEVGVDVANATVMVVMDADRFGVSQLHQLRGRVGRGAAPGLCLLVADEPAPSALERLLAVAATTDGFELARLDLEQRSEGDVLGARQSGRGSQLRLLRLLRDEDLIVDAREDAQAIVQGDPTLAQHPALRQRVESAIDEEQAAFLERS